MALGHAEFEVEAASLRHRRQLFPDPAVTPARQDVLQAYSFLHAFLNPRNWDRDGIVEIQKKNIAFEA